MTDNRDKIQSAKEKKCEDTALWENETKSIKPIRREKQADQASKVKSHSKVKKNNTVQNDSVLHHIKTNATSVKKEMDLKSAQKLKTGNFKIERRLDLHGLTREAAYDALTSFLINCNKNKIRTVLIITGKGAKDPLHAGDGVLKKSVPIWLSTPPLNFFVIRYELAKPKDGGSGALYVRLSKPKQD